MNTEDIYHNSPDESADLDNSHYAEYVQLEQQEMESQPKAVTEVIMHLDCSRDSWQRTGQYMISLVKDGNENPAKMAATISAAVKALDMAKEGIREDVIREIEKHGKRALLYGTEMEVKEAGVKYTYDFCGDLVLNQLLEEQAAITAKVKKRQEFLKTLIGSQTLRDDFVNPQTGEVQTIDYTVYPPRKTSTTTYQITHK
jgi:hypothetical protein